MICNDIWCVGTLVKAILDKEVKNDNNIVFHYQDMLDLCAGLIPASEVLAFKYIALVTINII